MEADYEVIGCSVENQQMQNWDEVEMEAGYRRTKFDKGTGQIVDADVTDKPDVGEEFFEAVDAGAGEQFQAVKPWIGAVVEPENRKYYY